MKAGQLIIIGITIFASSACGKIYRCETWEVNDHCTKTGDCYYIGCNVYASGIHQEEICGKALNDARSNNTITIKDNCTTRKRTFIRKL
jgi:hypothetical protein